MSIFRQFGKKGSLKENEGKQFEAAAILGEPSEADVRAIRLNAQTTIIMGIRCGGCGKEWKDAFYPDRETQVACPFCGGINKATVTLTEEKEEIHKVRLEPEDVEMKSEDGIQILMQLITQRGILLESDLVEQAVTALNQEGTAGSKRLASLIDALLTCRSPKLKTVIDAAGQIEPAQELIDVLLKVKQAKELAPMPAGQQFQPEILGEGKIGWTTGTAEDIRRKSVKALEKLTGAVVTSHPMARPGADLDDADLAEAEFDSADLQGASFINANLEKAVLRHARLDKADLEGANLQDANLYFANLTGANLQGANLQGANLYMSVLKDANLKGADLAGAYGPNGITLPDGNRGGINELKQFT